MAIIRAFLVVAALTAMPVLYGLAVRLTAPAVNDAVYPALRSIEQTCRAEERPTVACRAILDKANACDSESERCRDQDYYCAVAAAGFDLPPFYTDGRELRC